MTIMAGRQAIMEIFRMEGVEYIFGNPGTTELGFMDMLQDYPQLQYIVCLHESVALGAAQMYANASGKTGVVNLHVAPGLGNALGALYNAAVGKMPLVVTAGQQDSRMVVREPVLSYDLVSMAAPLAKWSVQLQHVEEIPVIFPRAFKVAQDAPRGPVFIALPGNVIDQEADLHLPGPTVPYRRNRPDPEGLTGEYSAIRRVLGDADVVLAVGADLFDEVFYNEGPPLPDGCALIHLDHSPWEIGKNLPTTVGLLADPKLALQELAEVVVPQMAGAAQQAAEQRRTAMATRKQQERDRQAARAAAGANTSPIAPAQLMATLRDCLPANVVIYNESITAEADLTRTIPLELPNSLFGNHGGGIGQGLPGAIGVKLAQPERPVVALVGDGSAMYTIQSLWTAARYHLPILYIILSNRSYRLLKLNMNRYRRTLNIPAGRPYPFMDLTDPPLDFVEVAHGMGMAGKRITHAEEIEPAVQEALSLGTPYILEVMTEGRVPSQ